MGISIDLYSSNMGDVTEDDFDNWVAFVNDRIDDKCGFTVDVNQMRFRDASIVDRVHGATDEQEETVREAMRVLWDEWCREGAPAS